MSEPVYGATVEVFAGCIKVLGRATKKRGRTLWIDDTTTPLFNELNHVLARLEAAAKPTERKPRKKAQQP